MALRSPQTIEMLDILNVSGGWENLSDYEVAIRANAVKQGWMEKDDHNPNVYRITDVGREALAEAQQPKRRAGQDTVMEIGLTPGETSEPENGRRKSRKPKTDEGAAKHESMWLELELPLDDTPPAAAPEENCAECDCLPKRVLDLLIARNPDVAGLVAAIEQQEAILKKLAR